MTVKQSELAWIGEARKHIGLAEIKGSKHNAEIIKWLTELKAWWKDDETPWCGVFVAWCLKSAGIPYPKDWYRALAYADKTKKLKAPCYGCVAVKTRKGGGHVCFVVGMTPSGKLVCLGGNQSDKVCFALYDKSDFEGFYWYGKTNTPLAIRFELPILSGVTATKVTEA